MIDVESSQCLIFLFSSTSKLGFLTCAILQLTKFIDNLVFPIDV